MDDRIRDRRRSVNRQRGRRRAGLVLVVVLVVAAAILFVWLRSSDVFAVRRVTVTAVQYSTEEQIAGLTAEAVGSSLLKLSTRAIEEGLLSLPYVRTAEVYRRFPDTLDIRLVEYEPLARLQVKEGETWLVAENGRILEKATPPRGLDLPLVAVTGSVAPVAGGMLPAAVTEGLAVVAMLEAGTVGEGLPTVERIVVSTAGRIVVVLKDGGELRLGDSTGLQHKLMVAVDIIERYLRDGKQIAYVDLTVPERAAVKVE